ncbi:maleylacetoacetate isomerase [Mesorhizobium kowhaii]|uniref:Maleylacetoacetate isomerase n=1 Tax=Mesorhizobium kowhaii TaxID=1300272 RepID=A0A2W7C7J5_9HYPH|nr:maleylacetoacetate isomerase [Mesorhizobium kowhaii]PZV38867.1 maleylacetoacetate isomerase [Mesorhizobium kowhaii]
MRFHGYFRSSASYRCRIAFGLKHVEYDLRPVHLRRGGGEQNTPDYRQLNPQGLVPALETAGLVLTQSLAIVEWLDERYPEPPLLPADSDQRALVRGFAQAIACDIHPLQNLRVLRFLTSELELDQAQLDRWCQHWIGEGLMACEALIAGNEFDFAFGDAPGLADICLVPQMYSADRFGVDLERMPRLRAVRDRCEALPAFAAAHPSRQPDADA